MFKFQRKVVLAKLEASYGVDAAPSGAANAILLRNVTITPLAATELPRDNIKPYLGNDPSVLAGQHVLLTCDVELAGSGDVDTAPKFGPLLRGCGLAETVTPDTSVEYDPVSDGEESLSIYFYHAGSLHKLLGTRGSWGLTIAAEQTPLFNFSFTGIFDPPGAQALPTPDFTGFQPPLHVSNTNTPTFSLHGEALVLEQFQLAMNNQVVHRDLVNSEQVIIAARAPSGSARVETPAIGDVDFFDRASKSTLGALQLVHGTGAGNILTLDCPKIQVTGPGYEDSENVSMLALQLRVLPDSGDDEVKLTFT